LGNFSKEEVSSVDEKGASPFFFYLGYIIRFDAATTERAPESPARLDLTHHIIGVNEAEMDFGYCLKERTRE